MPKRVTILLKGTIEVPDNADILRFKDEDGIESDHIRLKGRLFRPYISWMEYFSTAIMKKNRPDEPGGQCWQTADDEVVNEFLHSFDEEWYLEDIPGPALDATNSAPR